MKPEVKTNNKIMTQGWKPVRRGGIYCSPRCGRGCTHEEYLTATEKAAGLCRQLGPQWEPKVWENLGWHYSAQTKNCELHRFSEDDYWADLNVEGVQYAAHGETPKKAVRNVKLKILKALRNVNKALSILPL